MPMRCVWCSDGVHQCSRKAKYRMYVPWQKEALRAAKIRKAVYCKKCLLEMLNYSLDYDGWKKLTKVRLS